jgi:hypothetical protein
MDKLSNHYSFIYGHLYLPFLGWLLGDLVATLELFLGKKATFSVTPERKERKLRYFSFFFGVYFRYDSS